MVPEAAVFLQEATGQKSLFEAVSYLGEGGFIGDEVDKAKVLRALFEAERPRSKVWREAVNRLAREVADSVVNTASCLLAPELITPPSVYRKALDMLAMKCPGRTLAGGVDARVVGAALKEDPNVLEALMAVAGLSWGDLKVRANLPKTQKPEGPLDQEALGRVVAVVNEVVGNEGKALLPGSIPSRPIELLGDPIVGGEAKSGWAHIETLRVGGVPYEVLLAQRVAGGAWRTHRDRTGSKLAKPFMQAICERLVAAGIKVERASGFGGTLTRANVDKLVGGGGDQIAALLLKPNGKPFAALAISVANDGGSAAKSGARLGELPRRVSVPVYGIVVGPGWCGRNETGDLAMALGGRLFSDARLEGLVQAIVELSKES